MTDVNNVISRANYIADIEERKAFLTSILRGEVDGVKNSERIKACEQLGKLAGDFTEIHRIEQVAMPTHIELVCVEPAKD
jgi:hypothetical protein